MRRRLIGLLIVLLGITIAFSGALTYMPVFAEENASLKEILEEEGACFSLNFCKDYFCEHGNSPCEGYSNNFYALGCRNYESYYYRYRYGIKPSSGVGATTIHYTTTIPFYIDDSISEERADEIRYQASLWNEIVMHDGSEQLVNFFEVAQAGEYQGKPVVLIEQKSIFEYTRHGEFNAEWQDPIITLTTPARSRIDTVLHEFGHVLGLWDLDGGDPLGGPAVELEEDNNSWEHTVLMGYARPSTNVNTAIQYQDIQGVAVINGLHTNHLFERYGYSEENGYIYPCFYCDCAYAMESPIAGTEEFDYATACEHSYRPLVSAGNRHWSKCIYCYKVIEKETFNISYQDVGGVAFSGTHADRYPTTHAYETETQLKTPTKIGKTFVGWFLTQNGTGTPITVIAGEEFNSDITLYAKWENATYNISYQDVGGTTFSGVLDEDHPTTHTYGTETALPTPTRPSDGVAAAFAGWYTNSFGMGTPVTSLSATRYTENITLYAKWIETYTITYMDVGGLPFSGTLAANAPLSVAYGSTAELVGPTLAAPTKTGYTFGGWHTAIDAYQPLTTTVVGEGTVENLLVFAKWIKTDTSIWNGTIASGFAGGDGSYDSPWQIENGEQLAYMAQMVNDGLSTNNYFVLIADIYLNNVSTANWRDGTVKVWTPIGTPTNYFNGDFNGAGHVIYGLYVNTTTSQQGLFRMVKEGVVRNLGIEDSYVKGGSYVGSIAGTVNDGTIVNCYNTGTIVGNNSGGIVGRAINGSFVQNNYNTCPMVNGGGIVGNTDGSCLIDYNYYLQTETINAGITAIRSGAPQGNNFAVDVQGYLLDEDGMATETVSIGGVSYDSIPNALNAFVNEGFYDLHVGDLVLWHWLRENGDISHC